MVKSLENQQMTGTLVGNESQNGNHAYSEAAKSGLYAKKTGLVGKYDSNRVCTYSQML